MNVIPTAQSSDIGTLEHALKEKITLSFHHVDVGRLQRQNALLPLAVTFDVLTLPVQMLGIGIATATH